LDPIPFPERPGILLRLLHSGGQRAAKAGKLRASSSIDAAIKYGQESDISIHHSHHWIGHTDKKVNKEISELNDTIAQMDLTDIYRIFHPAAA
jgi:hypothetical protein